MREWTPNSRYGGHAFGFGTDPSDADFAHFLAAREEILPWLNEYSPYANVTPDDPPTYLFYPTPPALGQPEKDPTHSANFGVKLQEKARAAGLDCELVYPGAPDVKHPTIADYLIDRLTQRSTFNIERSTSEPKTTDPGSARRNWPDAWPFS
jgi:hypothetical protein